MTTDFLDTVLCKLVQVDQRFRGAYFFHNQETISTSETSVYFWETTRSNNTEV